MRVLCVLVAGCLCASLAPAGEGNSKIELTGGVTLVAQRPDDGRIDSSLTGSFDLYLFVPDRRGRFEVYVEGSTTPRGIAAEIPEANADAGTALNRDQEGRFQVSEFKYDLGFEGGGALAAGLIDLSAYFDTTRIGNDENLQFLAAPFVNNPTIELPDYTVGAAYRRPSRGRRPRIHVTLASSAGLGDSADRSYSALFDSDESARGLFAAVETGWDAERWQLRVGLWHHGGDHEALDDGSGGRDNSGVYATASRTVGGNAFNVRAGVADRRVSAAHRFGSLSYVLDRGARVFGAGLALSRVSSALAGAEDMAHLELYLSLRIGTEWYLTPSLQHVWNAGFSAEPRLDRTTVFGLRLHRAF